MAKLKSFQFNYFVRTTINAFCFFKREVMIQAQVGDT